MADDLLPDQQTERRRKNRERMALYRAANRAAINAKKRAAWHNRSLAQIEKDREREVRRLGQKREAARRYRAAAPERVSASKRSSYDRHSIKNRARARSAYWADPDSARQKRRQYAEAHRDKINAARRTPEARQRRNAANALNRGRISKLAVASRQRDPQTRLAYRLRSRLWEVLRERPRAGSAVRDLGCSVSDFKAYIERLWLPGMSWENWGQFGWHLDHIRPLASFDLTDPAQFADACHYTNYQPLWWRDNIRKGAKLFTASWPPARPRPAGR